MKYSTKISLKLCKLEYSYLVCSLIMMYCTVGLRTSLLLLFFLVFIYFSFSLHFSSKISPQRYRIETSGLQVHNDMLYRGIENGPSLICSSLYFFIFSFSPDFSSKISLQPFKIETSNLVYRFTTSCIVELKMGLFLFVPPYICSFFYLSRFFVRDIFTTV